MEPSQLNDLLLRLLPRLQRAAAARSRRDADADDLVSTALVLFLERAPRWFAQAPVTSLEAQAWTLLRFCLRNAVTSSDRDRHRVVPWPGDPDRREAAHFDPADPGLTPQEDVEGHEVAAERERLLHAAVEDVTNPVYRLLLVATYVPRWLGTAHFELASRHTAGGARPFVRPWMEAAAILLTDRDQGRGLDAVWAEQVSWRARIAIALRTADPMPPWGTDPPKLASWWMDQNLSRARASLGLETDPFGSPSDEAMS